MSATEKPFDRRAGILVWGLHTRLFHWCLVLLFTVLLTTGLSDNLDWMVWHQRCGYAVLALLIFRLLSGIWGKDYAGFRHFPLHPARIRDYLSGRSDPVGHNPLGAWMVVAMLLTLLIQVVTGFLTSDDFFVEGPWVFWADDDWVDAASFLHARNWILLAVLVGLHIAAAIFYLLIKRKNLILPMVTGYKSPTSSRQPPPSSAVATPLRHLLFLVLAAACTWALIEGPTLL